MRSQSQVTTYSPRKSMKRTKDYQSQRKKILCSEHIEREPVMNQPTSTLLTLIFIVYGTVCRGKAHSK